MLHGEHLYKTIYFETVCDGETFQIRLVVSPRENEQDRESTAFVQLMGLNPLRAKEETSSALSHAFYISSHRPTGNRADALR